MSVKAELIGKFTVQLQGVINSIENQIKSRIYLDIHLSARYITAGV